MKLNHNYLRACVLAASKDQTRAYLNSVYVKWEKDKTIYVSTDGHRLHMVEEVIDNGEILLESVILPTGLIPQLSHLLPNPRIRSRFDGNLGYQIECAADGNKLKFTACTNESLISGFESKGIDATYPDYTRVIPKKVEDLKDGEVIGFNFKFWMEAQEAYLIASGRKIGWLSMQSSGPSAPAKTVMNFDSDTFTAVVMPMRV